MVTGFPNVGSRQWRSQHPQNGQGLSQCRQPSMKVSTSTMVTGFPNVGSRQWRFKHPQWSQAFPMSTAVNEGLNIHNGHRLSQCRQPSMEVSTSTKWSEAFPMSAAVIEGFNIHNGHRVSQCRQPSTGSQHSQWSQAFPMSAAVNGGLNIHKMVRGFPNIGSRQ
jgi:hypothetical protein